MKLDEIFPSKYLKASDLQGHEPTVVIADVQIELLGTDRKPVIYFQGHKKALVCNVTNARTIAYLYGEDTDGWIGKEIVLYEAMANFQGKTGPALRVKGPQKRAANGQAKHVVTDRGGYQTSEMRRPDAIEQATGRLTQVDPREPTADSEVPF